MRLDVVRNRKLMLSRRLVMVGGFGYVIGFVAWRLLIASPLFARWWPLQVSDIFGVWSLLPLPFILIANLMRPNRWLLVALLLPLLWFCRDYGNLFLPEMASPARASIGGENLRVMSLNSYYLYDSDREFQAAVEQIQPDVIALQEVNPVFASKFGELAETWPYQERASVRITGQVALLSKFPILSVESDDDWLGCHCLQAIIDWHGQEIRVIVVHIRAPSFGSRVGKRLLVVNSFDASDQALSFDRLLPLIESSPEPVVVVGDFNTTERQTGYKRLYEIGLKDAHEEVGWGLGLTYPAPFHRFSWLPFPLIRIDHVFYDESWRAVKTWTMSVMRSDHQALVADLQWVGDE